MLLVQPPMHCCKFQQNLQKISKTAGLPENVLKEELFTDTFQQKFWWYYQNSILRNTSWGCFWILLAVKQSWFQTLYLSREDHTRFYFMIVTLCWNNCTTKCTFSRYLHCTKFHLGKQICDLTPWTFFQYLRLWATTSHLFYICILLLLLLLLLFCCL